MLPLCPVAIVCVLVTLILYRRPMLPAHINCCLCSQNELCIAFGPGKDMKDSTRIIATLQYEKAMVSHIVLIIQEILCGVLILYRKHSS